MDMKRLIQWLARVFDADITVTRTITKVVEKPVAPGQTVDGDITIDGNLCVRGSLSVSGGVTCYKPVNE